MNEDWQVGPADPDELAELAAVAARCQADPERYCCYVSDDSDSIAADVAEVDDWAMQTTVVRDDGAVVGWLLAEGDDEIGRTWWWGPFVDDDHAWDAVADALWEGATWRLANEVHTQQELAGDSRSQLVAAFAARHGFHAEEGSACLVLEPDDEDDDLADATDVGATITTVESRWASQTAALHDELFRGTHRTGADVAASDGTDEHCLVAVLDDRVVGYVATEIQNDQSLYVDFVGVEPEYRGRGIGRALVATACQRGFAADATHAHLTVRASNAGARALYDSLGFETERVLAPYRSGFNLAAT